MKATKTLIQSVAPEGFDNFVLKCVICGDPVPAKRATGRSRDTCTPACNDIFRAFKKWQSQQRYCPACFHPSTPQERADFLQWRRARGDRRERAGRPRQTYESLYRQALRKIANETTDFMASEIRAIASEALDRVLEADVRGWQRCSLVAQQHHMPQTKSKETIMRLFAPKCPMCQSVEWTSYAKDDSDPPINLLIQCSNCGTIRERLYTPAEAVPQRTQ